MFVATTGARIVSAICRPEDATNIASAITSLGFTYARFDGKWGTADGEWPTVELRVATHGAVSHSLLERFNQIKATGVQFLVVATDGWML